MTYKHFSVEERERIQRGLWEKRSIRAIAKELGRSHTAVSRELRRNYPECRKAYFPRLAEERAQKKRKSRSRHERLKNLRVREYVISNLKRRRSPEQIAGCIKQDVGETISHEAIYQFIYAQIYREGYGHVRPSGEDLRHCLRRRRRRRVPHGARKGQRVLRPKGPSIEDRPKIVDHRSRIGDWESDTVESKGHKPGINTLVERKTGLVFITKLKDKTSAATIAVIAERMRALPVQAKHTITMDNGPENSNWQELEAATDLDAFFAHPYS
jgi:transposase, IS30 family